MEFTIVIFVMLFVGIAIVGSQANEKRVKQAWGAFAAANDMQFQATGPNRDLYIEGQHNDVDVTVEREIRGSGKNRTVYTCFHAYLRNKTPDGMVLSSENVGDRISKFFGGQDIELGDEHADSQLRIRGADVEGIREFLSNKGILDAVMDFVTDSKGRIERGRVRLVISGTITNGDVINMHLDTVTRAAVRIDDAMTVANYQDAVRDVETEQDPSPTTPPAATIETPPAEEAPTTGPAEPTPPPTEPEHPAAADGPAAAAPEAAAPSEAEAPSEAAAPSEAEAPPEPEAHKEAATKEEVAENETPGPTEEPPADKEPLTASDLESVMTASRSDREAVLASLTGRRYSGRCTVDRVVWTSDPDASDRVYGGRSVVGKLDSGAPAEIAFPREREDEVKSLRSGDTLEFTAELMRYNDFGERLELEAW